MSVEDWNQLREMLLQLAEKLDQCCFKHSKNIFHLDLKKAKKASALASQCRRLANRTLTWPGLSQEASKGEEEVLWEMYVKLRREANKITPIRD